MLYSTIICFENLIHHVEMGSTLPRLQAIASTSFKLFHRSFREDATKKQTSKFPVHSEVINALSYFLDSDGEIGNHTTNGMVSTKIQ